MFFDTLKLKTTTPTGGWYPLFPMHSLGSDSNDSPWPVLVQIYFPVIERQISVHSCKQKYATNEEFLKAIQACLDSNLVCKFSGFEANNCDEFG